jgi:hypothetical protein
LDGNGVSKSGLVFQIATPAPTTEPMQQIAVLFVDADPLVRSATVRLLTPWNVTAWPIRTTASCSPSASGWCE